VRQKKKKKLEYSSPITTAAGYVRERYDGMQLYTAFSFDVSSQICSQASSFPDPCLSSFPRSFSDPYKNHLQDSSVETVNQSQDLDPEEDMVKVHLVM
jgi:hypothetical protein